MQSTAPLGTGCASCGASAPALAQFCGRCGRPLPVSAGPSARGTLKVRWQAQVQDPPGSALAVMGPFLACPGRRGGLALFHESSPSPRLVTRLPDGGPFLVPALVGAGLLLTASPSALVSFDLVPRLSGRRVAGNRDRVLPLPGPPASALATDGASLVGLVCQAAGQPEVHLFECTPRRGLEALRVLRLAEEVPGSEAWHLWIRDEHVLVGPSRGGVTVLSARSGAVTGRIPLPGGLADPRSFRTGSLPVAVARDGSVLELDPRQPDGSRLLFRPERDELWALTVDSQGLYACVGQALAWVPTASMGPPALETLPGFSVVAPATGRDGCLALTSDGHGVLSAPEGGTLTIRSSLKLFDAPGGAAIAPARTDQAFFVCSPTGVLIALEVTP